MKLCKSEFKKAAVLLMLLLFSLSVSVSAATVVRDMTKEDATTWNVDGQYTEATTVYHRIVLPKAGLLTVFGYSYNGTSTSGLTVSLCNASRKSLEKTKAGIPTDPDSKTYSYYALKAGTYYIRVDNQKNYSLGALFTKAPDKGGNTKAAATYLKRNKAKTGLMLPGEKKSKADWFRITFKKDRYINLSVSVLGNAALKVILIGPNIPKGGIVLRTTQNMAYNIPIGLKNSSTGEYMKLPAGTYYVKFVREKKGNSAYYEIGWK